MPCAYLLYICRPLYPEINRVFKSVYGDPNIPFSVKFPIVNKFFTNKKREGSINLITFSDQVVE